MNKMENNNGRGVFYGVIGVATLIVSIIGATFAYFSAVVNSAPNTITAGATILSLSLSEDRTGLKGDMIPVETDGTTAITANQANATEDKKSFPFFPSPATGLATISDGYGKTVHDAKADRAACKDLLGNNICSIYTFTVYNPSTTASQQIYGYLTIESNTFTNLKYAVFKGTAADVDKIANRWEVQNSDLVAGYSPVDGNYNLADGALVKSMDNVPRVAGTKAAAAAEGITNDADYYSVASGDEIPAMTVTLPPSTNAQTPDSKVTYTILLWIEETGTDQTGTDSTTDGGTTAHSFAGGIRIDTSGGGNGVTGTLRLTSTKG